MDAIGDKERNGDVALDTETFGLGIRGVQEPRQPITDNHPCTHFSPNNIGIASGNDRLHSSSTIPSTHQNQSFTLSPLDPTFRASLLHLYEMLEEAQTADECRVIVGDLLTSWGVKAQRELGSQGEGEETVGQMRSDRKDVVSWLLEG